MYPNALRNLQVEFSISIYNLLMFQQKMGVDLKQTCLKSIYPKVIYQITLIYSLIASIELFVGPRVSGFAVIKILCMIEKLRDIDFD